jgi:altronate dehydratase small subunit
MTDRTAIVMEAADNVATVLRDIAPQTEVELSITDKKHIVRVLEKVNFGHKFAIRDIKRGEHIVKYGEPIGVATRDIASGQHVHIHNLESERGRGDKELPR